MAEKFKGELQFVRKNDFGFWSVKVGGVWYGTGQKTEPAGVVVGDIVEGEWEADQKTGKYKNVVKGSLVKATGKAPAGAAGSSGNTMSKGEWAAKDDAIRYQSSRKDALAFLALPGVLDAIVAKAKPAEKVGIIEALVDKYTASFFADVATFGAVARATGAVSDDDKQAPPSEDDDE